MREINSTLHTKIEVLDEKGSGGGNHIYRVIAAENLAELNNENIEDSIYACVNFQNGAIKENGVNGCCNEDLLAIVIDRLQGFQSGDFKCRENAIALTHIETALIWLNKRTADRSSRGVEGTSNI